MSLGSVEQVLTVAFRRIIGLRSHCIRLAPSLKPDCRRAHQRKSGKLTPFDPDQFILFGPLCGGNLTNTGMFCAFRGKRRGSFSAVKTCWRSRQSGANLSLPKFPANRESCKFWGPKNRTSYH
jgi:hypothetical protein